MRVAVVGGGIAGLTAAYRLSGRGHDVTCFDADARPGGLAGNGRSAPSTYTKRRRAAGSAG